MRRYPVVLACLLLGLMVAPDFSRGFFPALDWNSIEFKPSVQFGYQRLGFNFNLPTSRAGFSPIQIVFVVDGDGEVDSIDLKFQDANTWVGALELGADVGPNLYLFLRGEANAPRGVDVITEENDVGFFSVVFPYQWRGSGMEWWAVELGGDYAFPNGFSFLAGFRVDHMSLKLRDPVDRAGNPVNFAVQQLAPIFDNGITFSLSENAFGDLQTKLWIPYVGLSVDGVNYRMKLLWSPFVWAKVSIPLRLLQAYGIQSLGLTYEADRALDFRYHVYSPACFLEANFQYDVELNNMFGLQLWCRYSWLNARGRGSMGGRDDVLASLQTNDGLFVGSLLGSGANSDSSSAWGTFGRYTLTLGITGLLSF
jgi:hypothetical protein